LGAVDDKESPRRSWAEPVRILRDDFKCSGISQKFTHTLPALASSPESARSHGDQTALLRSELFLPVPNLLGEPPCMGAY